MILGEAIVTAVPESRIEDDWMLSGEEEIADYAGATGAIAASDH